VPPATGSPDTPQPATVRSASETFVPADGARSASCHQALIKLSQISARSIRNPMCSGISRSARRRIVCSSSPYAAAVRCGVLAGRCWLCTNVFVTTCARRGPSARDQRHRLVKRHDTPCRRHNVPVDDENLLGHTDTGKRVAKHRDRVREGSGFLSSRDRLERGSPP
jgi:hypothetical protein